mgnify:CR=1 FL=1
MTDELLKALQVIKEECVKRDDSIRFGRGKNEDKCKGCPLSDCYDDCGIMETKPSEWKLEKREVYF